MYTSWLTSELKAEVRRVFEPRYKRELTDEEVEEIAENLSGYVEIMCKFKYEQMMKDKLKK